MLVLSRKTGETIMVGEVTITVVEIRGDKVRLGIQCPATMPVYRQEVLDMQRAAQKPPQE